MSGAFVSVVCCVSCREELRSLERVRGGTIERGVECSRESEYKYKTE